MNDVDWGGPYLAAAFFCEKILEEKDGVNSAIRIVDRIMADVVLPHALAPAPPMPVQDLVLFLSFRSGKAQGTASLQIRMIRTSGIAGEETSAEVFFESGEERPVNILAPLGIQITEPGVLWFEIRLNGKWVTRVPLRVIVRTQVRPGGAPPP